MTDFLAQGTHVSGPSVPGTVAVIAHMPTGDGATTLYYEELHTQQMGQVLLYPEDLAALTALPRGTSATFDGDGEAWRLAAEALRIKYAALYDPMIAVTTSDNGRTSSARSR